MRISSVYGRRAGVPIVALLALAAAGFAAWSFLLGPGGFSSGEIVRGLIDGEGAAGIIAREIRLPRALLGLIVGAALGGSGAALQGLFLNPLAEPGVTGVSACAALGAVVALYFGLAASHLLLLPAFAVAGAAIAAGVLFALSRAGAGSVSLILAGVALSSLAAALTALALSLSANPYAMSEIVLWLMGSIRDRTLNDLAYVLPMVVVGLVLLVSAARGLDALSLGEDAAASLGVDVVSLRGRVILGVALATGAATAVAGAIGFVGLVVPHVLRPLFGFRPARLILPSALGGAVLVSAADTVLRLLAPDGTLLLGVATALIGAPFFLALVLDARRRPGGWR